MPVDLNLLGSKLKRHREHLQVSLTEMAAATGIVEDDLAAFENGQLVNVTDTCAVWNILSSRLVYSTARSAGCSFCCTYFVHYECLHKPRTNPTKEERELQARFRKECEDGGRSTFHLDIDDLQDVAILQNRNRLSKGELSSIVLALKIRHAFLTDDQKARKLAGQATGQQMVQTTPQLFGWLFFAGLLVDADKGSIIEEHSKLKRQLGQYLEEMYYRALQY